MDDFLAAHDKWMRDDNYLRPFAHEKRDDGCHSPAAVLQWMKEVQPEPELVEQAFSAMCETRRLNKAGYARFRNCLLYGERNLAGETGQVDSLQDGLTLDSNQERLSRHSVEWAPDDHHFPRVGYPRLYDHRSLSAQCELWQPGDVEWFVIIRDPPRSRRRKRKSRMLVLQPPVFEVS
ncbi:hypothetical protein [Thermosporothrix hazakensis]|uniref:hypothetical protein n=1 Tax=Thermosporothrix hazakensis TaxID=644383 RepID=UPI0010FA2331|nr:hypothetical protein [Thermosporothrix hazakensis]